VSKQPSSSSALLNLHTSLRVVYDTATRCDVDGLRTCFHDVLGRDLNTACRILEKIPEAWSAADRPTATPGLCRLYLEACAISSAPEVQAQSLLNLGSLMDGMLRRGDLTELPRVEQLDELWNQLQKGYINPTLSCAITETSGTIMAVLVSRDSDRVSNMEQRLRSWGDMLSECLEVDQVSLCRYLSRVGSS
jgi:hypothetical protein